MTQVCRFILLVSFSTGVLCGGTTAGNVLFWRHTSSGWDPMAGCKVRGSIKFCAWGGALLAVNAGNSASILQEHNLCAAYSSPVSIAHGVIKL